MKKIVSLILVTSIVVIFTGCAGSRVRNFLEGRDPAKELAQKWAQNEANLKVTLNSWIGHNGDELMSAWGAPSSITPLMSGGRLLTYYKATSISFPGTTTTKIAPTFGSGSVIVNGSARTNYNQVGTLLVPETTPGSTVNLTCQKDITVDKKNIITTWSYRGNCDILQ